MYLVYAYLCTVFVPAYRQVIVLGYPLSERSCHRIQSCSAAVQYEAASQITRKSPPAATVPSAVRRSMSPFDVIGGNRNEEVWDFGDDVDVLSD